MWTLRFAAHASMKWYALKNQASTRRPGSSTLAAPSRNARALRMWVSNEDIRVLITRHVLKSRDRQDDRTEWQSRSLRSRRTETPDFTMCRYEWNARRRTLALWVFF